MVKLDLEVFRMVREVAGLTTAQVGRILERPIRTLESWKSNKRSRRKMPPGEIERLCMLIDPLGERHDIIGWVVIAARGRYERSVKTAAAQERESRERKRLDAEARRL